jgi:hypothetical protein
MTDDPDTQSNRLDRLVSLVELTRYAEPEDPVRLERTIQFVSLARQGVAQARQEAALLAELRIMIDRIPR